jgi:integrase/recombinase XerD
LFQHAEKDERLLLKFFLASGFRDREVQYLSWRDIDFNNSVVRVTAKPACGFIPKNWGERIVPLPFSLIEELQALRESRGAFPAYLVFPNSRGNRNKGYIALVKLVAQRAGLNCARCTTKFGNKCDEGPYCRNFFLHKFRHTFATEYLRCGVDIRSLQLWMGHRDIQSTMVYLRGLESSDALIKVNASSLAALVR